MGSWLWWRSHDRPTYPEEGAEYLELSGPTVLAETARAVNRPPNEGGEKDPGTRARTGRTISAERALVGGGPTPVWLAAPVALSGTEGHGDVSKKGRWRAVATFLLLADAPDDPRMARGGSLKGTPGITGC